MLFHSLQLFADFLHYGIGNNLLCLLILENCFPVGKSNIDCRSHIKGKRINHIIIGRAICLSLNIWDNVIYFLLGNPFGNLFHFPPVFRTVATVPIVFVIAPHPFSICILAVCSGWAPIVSIIHFVSSYWWRGWVLGFPEKCSSKISYPRPQRFLNYHIKGNCRSTSSMSCLMILYCSGKWTSAACR